ncbi:hypothetical protein OIO90_004489 [Microbotryomycetes sp. JL221]|nr:hypothetical protein OIO90_004489 [Microbotryomycetes sp. JL221]
MSAGRTQKQDLLVRVRYQNKLPPPPFAPRFVLLDTTPQRYATYEFLNALNSEREVPMTIDGELGMHLEVGKLAPGDTTHSNYWTGVDRSSVAPTPGSAAPLEDEDLALLQDVGGAATSQVAAQPGAAVTGAIAPRGKHDVSWLRRTEYLSSEGGIKPFALTSDKPKVPTATLSRDERFRLIEASFEAVERPLSELRHPSKPHVRAESSYELLPDDLMWPNKLNLVRFGEDPGENKTGSTMRAGADPRLPNAVFRPTQISEDEARIGYFLLEDEEQARRYRERREAGSDSIVQGEMFQFKWARDYELATSRKLGREFVFCVEDGDDTVSPEEEDQNLRENGLTSHKRRKGVYFSPLQDAQTLRKRRPRRGEDPKQFPEELVEEGTYFWDGIQLELQDTTILEEDDERAEAIKVLSYPPYEPEPTPEPEPESEPMHKDRGQTGDESASGGQDDDEDGEKQMAIDSGSDA